MSDPALRADAQKDYRSLLAVSISVAGERTRHEKVLRARDRMHLALCRWFPNGSRHGGARDVANNLAAWMTDEPAARRWRSVLASLRAKGLRGRDIEKAALAVCAAWSKEGL